MEKMWSRLHGLGRNYNIAWCKLSAYLLCVFKRILRTVYGYDDSQGIQAKLFRALAPAAKLLLETHCEGSGELTAASLVDG